MQTAPHVNFKGNCREAFSFYAETFGGRIVFAMTYGEAPGSENAPAEVRRQIIHARVDFDGQYLLGCDAPADRYQAPQGFAVMAAVEKPADAERIFKALAERSEERRVGKECRYRGARCKRRRQTECEGRG